MITNIRFVAAGFAIALGAAAGPLHAQQPAGSSAIERAARSDVMPGDQIEVRVAREPLLGDTVMVNERGEVTLPRLGTVQVSALTIAGLRDTLLARYRTFLRDPSVDVRGLRRITVHGEVKNPDVYMVDLATGVRDVIALAGGITETGHRGKVIVIRDGQDIPVRNWERDQSAASDLRSGDQVVVGRRSWFAINALPVASTALVFVSFAVSLLR